MRRFDELQVGERAELRHTITARDVERFVDLTGDDNRLHVDTEYAARTALKKPVAHGMLGASFISTVIGTKLPGDGALWFAQNLEFLAPVRVGDELTVRAQVIKRHERERVLELLTEVFNQDGRKVIGGTAKVRVVEEEGGAAAAGSTTPPKTALVVGGAGGIGQATCLLLAQDGFDVAVHCHRDEAAAAALAESIRALGRKAVVVQADVTDARRVDEMLQRVLRAFGGLGVLVHCATSRHVAKPFAALEWQDFAEHLDVGLRALFHLVRGVLPSMEAAHYGKIIAVTSQAIEAPVPQAAAYIAAKAALHGFVRALARELGPRGIRVNAVSPGLTDTALVADVPERTRLVTAASTPLQRLALPADVAGAIAYLASERADFLTGETIRVNGGQVML